MLIESGFGIEVLDAGHWRVSGFEFWPESGMIRRPDGSTAGGGVLALVQAVRAGGSRPPS
jgi:hypothetical protein